jgi:hypothetical protein
MNYTQILKYVGKCVVVLAIAFILRPFLDMLVISHFHLGTLLATWLGHSGIILMLTIDIVGIPILLAATVVGILGGLWIGGKVINGFVLSLIPYLFEFIIGITTRGLKFDCITFLSLLGLFVVPVIGTLIYGILSAKNRARVAF